MIKVNSREEYLLELKKLLPNNCIAAEIGVLAGDFSRQILDILNPKKLFLIDPYEVNDVRYEGIDATTAYSTKEDYAKMVNRFYPEILSRKISVYKSYSYEAVKKFFNGTLDFLYLDGSHLFEDTKRDLNDWLPKMKPDGLICGHDYIHLGNFGVIKAVDNFLNEHGFKIIIYNQNGGDWALIKI